VDASRSPIPADLSWLRDHEAQQGTIIVFPEDLKSQCGVYDDCGGTEEPMASVSVRYIVDDVAAAIAFYCEQLEFHEVMHPAPTFAMLDRGELRLVLSAPSSQGGGGQAMPDGTKPEPGGWNRMIIEVADLADRVQLLRDRGVHFRNDIVEGVGGKQILLEDPAGNPIELFEPGIPEARLVDR